MEPRRGPQRHIYVLNSVTTHAVIFLPVASKGFPLNTVALLRSGVDITVSEEKIEVEF